MSSVTETLLALFLREGVALLSLYGFGSHFSGETNPESDIDLAFLAERPVSNEKRWELQEELARTLKKNVDLVDLAEASLVMKMQVISKGQRIYCSDQPACDTFETYIYSAYCRFNEERKEIIGDIGRRGQVYS